MEELCQLYTQLFSDVIKSADELYELSDKISQKIIELFDGKNMEELCQLYTQLKNNVIGSERELTKISKKISKRIIEQFDYKNEEHYMLIDRTFLEDNGRIISKIVERIKIIDPYEKANNDMAIKRISLNGKFSLGYTKYKLVVTNLENNNIVAVLCDDAKDGDINNQGTQIISRTAITTNEKYRLVYDITNPNSIITRNLPFRTGSNAPIHSRWSPNGKYIAICYDRLQSDNIVAEKYTGYRPSYCDVHIYELIDNQWTCIKILATPEGRAYSATWNNNGEKLAVVYITGILRVWDLAETKVIHEISDIDYESCLGYNSDKYLATVTKDRKRNNFKINVWNIPDRKLECVINIIALNGVGSLCFHPEKDYILIMDRCGCTTVWDIHTRTKVSIFRGNKPGCFMTFNESGDKIISGSGIWNFVSIYDIRDLIRENYRSTPFGLKINILDNIT